MAQSTSIAWTDLSWNPVHGCSIVSTECRNCYAAELSQRYKHTAKPWTPENAAENVTLKPHKLREPLSGGKLWTGLGQAAMAAGKTEGKLVFVNSTSDLFHEQVPDEFIAQVFAVMALAPQHTFQILTKRPERMAPLLKSWRFCKLTVQAIFDIARERQIPNALIPAEVVMESFASLTNVWLGVSIGLRQFVRRADLLRDTPAAVRFISAEPLLGPLAPEHMFCSTCSMEGSDDHCEECEGIGDWWLDGGLRLDDIDWLIVGGESGGEHRPMNLLWASDLALLADDYGTRFFMKQDSGRLPGRKGRIPDELWVHEFPNVRALERSARASA
jgi:protein gp37